ncbi:MAG: SRPBCC family protein [Bacteroidetes bacterium]|nr:SRPBCC family protein [Bacteroidota bacterium]
MRWKSDNKELGDGYIKILTLEPDSVISEELNFSNTPSTSGFTLKENGDSTLVRWNLEFEVGSNPILRILGKFIDSMVRDDFENGLKNIKSRTEQISIPAP